MTAYLVELSSKNDLKTIAQQPDTILLVMFVNYAFIVLACTKANIM